MASIRVFYFTFAIFTFFFIEYKIDNRHNRAVCDFEHPPPADKACEVNMEDFGDCSPDNDFGYNTSFPCVYLKLNRVINSI